MISLNDLNRNRTKWIEQKEVHKKMLNYLMRIVATIFVIGIIQTTYGQKATEIFIPVGQSPGLSGKYTTLGTVNAVNEEEKTIIMSDSVETYTIKISDETMIWLDQSLLKLKNKTGSFESIKEGMLVEVKYLHNKPESAVEWIKVQITE
jgi:hypothetical protein